MNDFDIWQKEIDNMDWKTAVAPVIRGVMLVEDGQVDAYNKIQKLLSCPELESSHRFLYSLDPTELTEAEATKIANLYRLGQERGFIQEDEDEEDSSGEEDKKETNECDISSPEAAAPQPAQQPAQPAIPQSAYTVLYSATRDGQVKTGEAFSNAISTRSAKADVISKLERAGYQNIAILAIEAGDPDAAEAPNTYQKLPDTTIPDYSVSEDDMLDGRHHNNHVDEDDMLNGRKHNNHVDEGDEKDEAAKDDEKKSEDKPEKKEDVKEPDEKLKDKDDKEASDGKEDDAEDDEEELSNEKKGMLKDSYKKAFKAALQKCKFETSFSELTLEQKIDFFTELAKAWGDKEDPSKFMTDKELDQLEKIAVNKGQE